MSTSIESLMSALDEQVIAQCVGNIHDDARNTFRLKSNRVADFHQFADLIGDYYNHHCVVCFHNGGHLSRTEANARAKKTLLDSFRRGENKNIVSLFNDAQDGTNGGMRIILDKIAGALKDDAIENYTREVFDTHVAPSSWSDQVELLRQFIQRNSSILPACVRNEKPERFAREYEELIRAYVQALHTASSAFRRL